MKKEFFKTLTVIVAAHMCLASVACQKSASSAVEKAMPTLTPDAGPAPDEVGSAGEQQVDFKKWDAFVGNYRMVEFQGQAVSSRYTEIVGRASYFWDQAEQRNVESIVFPLFYSVSANSDAAYNFGVLKNKGESKLLISKNPETQKQIETLTYKFQGPITMQGQPIEMSLDLIVVSDGESLNITYTLEVKNHVKSITRNFKLLKSN